MPHPTPSTVDAAFREFMMVYRHEHDHTAQNQRKAHIVQEKSKRLIPMRQLLKRLVDLGVRVHHTNSYQATREQVGSSQPLDVYENDSSPIWQPGISLYLDHPAALEIAIPNASQIQEHGIVVIRCSTEHPESHVFHRRFSTMAEACKALAGFLGRSTVSIDRTPGT